MPFGSDENAVGIFRVDENHGDLLGTTQTEVRPRFSRVGGLVDSVAGREIRTLQAFAAAHVNDVRIGRCNRQRANRARGLVIENRIPGVAKIGALPDAAIDGGHVENVGLVRHAGDGHGAASAKRPDAAPAHLGVELLIELLRVRRSGKYCREDESEDEALPCRTDAHPRPPGKERGYSGCGDGATQGRRRVGK